MKYKLKNEFGNRVIFADNEKERNYLLSKGFKLDENYGKPADDIKSTTSKKRKVAKNNEGYVENKDKPKGNI